MLIDWFTVAAQALNFLILVWLMKHFLYQPILTAIDTREKRIAAELADAKAKQAEAKTQSDLFLGKTAEIDKQRASLLQQASDAAAAQGQLLLVAAQKSAAAVGAKLRQAQRDEQQRLAQSIAQRITDEVFAIASRALGDLASAELEDAIIALFLKKLRSLGTKATDDLAGLLRNPADGVVLRTTFALTAARLKALETELDAIFAAKLGLTWHIAPSLVCGIDLSGNGQRIGWCLADYLTALQSHQQPAAIPAKAHKARVKKATATS